MRPEVLLGIFLFSLPFRVVKGSTPLPDCIGVCTHNITSTGSSIQSASCSQLLEADQCFRDRPGLCNLTEGDTLSPVLATRSLITNRIFHSNCLPPVETTPTPTVPTGSCPQSFQQVAGSVISASVQPEGDISSECKVESSDHQKQLQHCSLFLDGYLRTFPAYRHGLQGCSLQGSSILFRHEQLQIEVEGTRVSEEQVSLTMVNVTVYPHACNGQQTRTYIARSNISLPSSFSDGHTPTTGSGLQLHMSDDRSVASILMVYANFTIVIRQMEHMLSVTLQVPGGASYRSDGLCFGCPRQQAVSVTSLVKRYERCPQHLSVLITCFSTPSFSQLDTIFNASYYDVCTPALYQAQSGSTSNFINSVGMDAIILPDDGVFPRRPDITPSSSTHTVFEQTSPSHTNEATPPVDVTTSYLNSQTPTKSSPGGSTKGYITTKEMKDLGGSLIGAQSAFHVLAPALWLSTCLLLVTLSC